MAYKNKHDKSGQNSSDGERAEEMFRELALDKGYMIIDASLEEQYKHTDFLMEKDGKMWKVDIKARKKLKRSDENYCDEWIWLEILNVRGDPGWIYGNGFIAFEMENHFVIISKKALADLVEKLVDQEKMVDKPHKAHYCAYRRFMRKDRITLIESKHLYEQEHKVWPK